MVGSLRNQWTQESLIAELRDSLRKFQSRCRNPRFDMLVVFRAFDQGEALGDDLEIIVVGLLVDLQKDTVS